MPSEKGEGNEQAAVSQHAGKRTRFAFLLALPAAANPPITPNSIATPTFANSQIFARREPFFVVRSRMRL